MARISSYAETEAADMLGVHLDQLRGWLTDGRDKTGLSVALITLIETHERSTKPETVRMLCDALGCKPEEISVVKQNVDGLYSEAYPEMTRRSKR